MAETSAEPAKRAATAAEPVKRAARDGVALGLAVGTSGLAFGAAAVASGLTPAQACVLSLVAYTGASQFALAAAVASGGNLIAGTASAVLLGSRNGLYGLRLASLLGFRGPFRLLAAQGITDESSAVALGQQALGRPGRAAARAGFLATFASLYLTWNAATLAGALGAGHLGSPDSFGLDVVGPAAFLALLWPRLRDGRTERAVALAGAAIALAATPFFPPGLPVVLAAVAALGAALLPAGRRRGPGPGRRLRVRVPPAPVAGRVPPAARCRPPGRARTGRPAAPAAGRAGERDLDRRAGHRGVLLRAQAGRADRAAAVAGSSPGAAVRHPGPGGAARRPDRGAGRWAAASPWPSTRPGWPAWARRPPRCCSARRSWWSSWRRPAPRPGCTPSAWPEGARPCRLRA